MTDHDFDLLTIGAGSGGVAATRRAGAHGARAAICEEDRAGGTCVLRGCIPKKLLVYAAHVSGEIEDAANYGWSIPETRFDWPTLIANKNTELARLNGIYNKMLADAGVELVPGRGRLIDAHTVEIETASGPRRATAETILIATGGWPSRPAIPGIEHAITSTEALDLATFPERVVVGGGGYIAVEFCGIFRHLGAQVTEIIRADHILRGFDEDVREHLEAEMRGQGIDIRAGCTIDGIRPDRNGLVVTCSDGTDIPAD
ncbi:MAG: FAD-dependent oxidoreductase, partial [Alphaproteobacteria bacterium]|nr:FAD-dependent oxidoreductase [Alphaproteobacteria bacterium]